MKTPQQWLDSEDELTIGHLDPEAQRNCIHWRRDVLLRVLLKAQRDAFDAGALAMLEKNKREVACCRRPDPKYGVACEDFDCLASAVTTDINVEKLRGRP